jgi:hypothetical protein
MDEPPTHALFAPFVGKRFSFEVHHVTLVLASVNTAPQFAAPGSKRIPFTLLFHGPVGDILPEGQYQVAIEDGPSVAFHIMPIHTPTPGRQDYQAVFN